MSASQGRIVYLNGDYVAEADAKVSAFDRGFLMADAVYEFTAVIDGKLLEFDHHLARLQRSLDALDFDETIDRGDLLDMHQKLVRLNNLKIGGVYMQISRGATDRDFAFPKGLTPTLFAFTQEMNFLHNPINDIGQKAISVEDGRWARRDIKTVQLLYTSMAKTMAEKSGADDAFFIKDGYITEATSSNVFMIKDDRIITRHLSDDILHGVTRSAIVAVAKQEGLTVEEAPFTIADAQNADEVFTTASPTFAVPIVALDGRKIGDGTPGEMTKKLRTLFLEMAMARSI